MKLKKIIKEALRVYDRHTPNVDMTHDGAAQAVIEAIMGKINQQEAGYESLLNTLNDVAQREIDELKAQLSTALSLSSAYKEGLEEIKDYFRYSEGTSRQADQIFLFNRIKKALDRGMEVVGYEVTHDTLKPEEPVGRDTVKEQCLLREEIIELIMKAAPWQERGEMYKYEATVITDHLLKTFRVERR